MTEAEEPNAMIVALTPKGAIEVPRVARALFDGLEDLDERPEGAAQELVINALVEAFSVGATTAAAELTASLIENGFKINLHIHYTPPDDPVT